MTTLDAYMLLEPNWVTPFKIMYRFNTSILRGIYGHEQRGALFSWPRRGLRFDTQFNSAADSIYYTGFMSKHIGDIIGVPVWAEQTRLTVQAAAGTATLNVTNASKFNFEVGAWVFIYGGDRSTYEVGRILTVTDTTITLTANLASTWAISSEVYPMLPMQLEQQVAHTKESSRLGKVGLLFKEAWNDEAVHGLGAHSFPTYNNYTVFNQEPNWVTALTWGINRPSERHVNLGVDLSYTREGESEFTLDASYMGDGVAAIADLKGLFNTHLGKWKQLWLPTWQKDITVTAAIGAADTSITIEDFDYINYWAGNNIIGKHLYFLFPDGTETYRKVIGWPSNTQLNLNGQIGTAVPAGHLSALLVCFLLPARFDIDEMEMSYDRVGLAGTRMRLQSLHDEVMNTSTSTSTTTTTMTTTTTTTTTL